MGGLFEGQVQQLPQGGETTGGQTPAWYQNLLYDQMMAARTAASQPFEPYALPRVAGQTPDQTAAYQSVRQNIGAWQPSFDVAMKGTQSLAGETPGVTSGVGYMQAAAGYNPMLTQQPYINQSSAELGNALRQNAFNVAAPSTYQAMGMSGYESAAPYLNQANYFSMNAAQPTAQLGAPIINQALGMSGIANASPYFTQAGNLFQNAAGTAAQLGTAGNEAAMQMSGLQAASPYLGMASNLGLGTVQSSAPLALSYLNPFSEAVTSQIAQLGERNLRENLLPAVSDQFIRAGQFGGSKMGEFGARALRDTQEAILREQSSALQQGYGQALGATQADLERQLQAAQQQTGVAQTFGNLTQAQQQALMQASQNLVGNQAQDLQRMLATGQAQANLGQTVGGLTQAQQQLMLQGAQNLVGNQAQDLQRMLQSAGQQAQLGQTAGGLTQAQQDIMMRGGMNLAGLRAQDLDRIMQGAQQYAGLGQQVAGATQQYGSMLQNIGQGIGSLSLSEAQRQQSALGQLADLGMNQQRMVAQDAAAMEAIGQSQQAQKQRELDAAYQQFQEQQRYPQAMLDWYQAQLKGVGQYLPSTTTQSGYTTQMGQSPLSQLATGLGAYKGFTSLND